LLTGHSNDQNIVLKH